MSTTTSTATTTSTERLECVDRLMANAWLSVVAKRFDKMACSTLDAVDASWEVMKDPLSEVLETVVFSTLGQFTIGCLETGVGITADLLDRVLPVEQKTRPETQKENVDKEPKGESSTTPESNDAENQGIVTRERRKSNRITNASTALVLSLRNLQSWLNSLKLDSHDDLCGQCAKRRKVIAPRRMGALHGLMHLSVGAVTAPLNLVGLNVGWDILKCAVTVSGNEYIDKSPVRPKSASEKRKHPELSSSDEEAAHTFHDDLEEYKSDEDVDYQPPEKDDSTDSDEYAQGETESDVSLGESPPPMEARAAKKGAKSSTDQTNQKNEADEKKTENQEINKNTEKTNRQLNGSKSDKEGGEKTDIVNGQEDKAKDGKKVVSDEAKVKGSSPLRKFIGI